MKPAMRDAWRRTTLGEVADIMIGRTPPRNDPRYWTTDLSRPFCTIADMTTSSVNPQREGVTELAVREGKARPVPAGGLLLSFKLSIGRVGFAARELYPNEAIAWLQPRSRDVDPRYLGHWLEHSDLTENASQAVKGKTLNSSTLQQLPVALPARLEQRRIVDLIGNIDGAASSALVVQRASSGALTALAIECWSAAAADVALAELGRVVTGATPPSGDRDSWVTPEVPFFTPGDFGGRLVLTQARRAVSRAGASSGRPLPVNSVAMVCIGATLGKTAVLGVPSVTNQQINALVGLDDVDAFCLAALLASPPGQARAWALSGRTTLPILNKSGWQSLRIPWPRRAVRERYAGLLRACEAALQAVTVEISVLGALRHAALDDLLSGEHVIAATYDRFLKAAS